MTDRDDADDSGDRDGQEHHQHDRDISRRAEHRSGRTGGACLRESASDLNGVLPDGRPTVKQSRHEPIIVAQGRQWWERRGSSGILAL